MKLDGFDIIVFIIIGLGLVSVVAILAPDHAPVPVPAAADAPVPAPHNTDGFRLVARISELEREMGHREAELDALADQLDSAIGELNAAGALLEKHGLKLHDDSTAIEP